jgi:hypothetical protein
MEFVSPQEVTRKMTRVSLHVLCSSCDALERVDRTGEPRNYSTRAATSPHVPRL